VSEFDRQLVELIDDVTGGEVLEARYLVDEYGAGMVARVIADGFGAVFSVPESASDYHEAAERTLLGCRFLKTDDAVALVQEPDGVRCR
jgi:class 3 adenylate cyclase